MARASAGPTVEPMSNPAEHRSRAQEHLEWAVESTDQDRQARYFSYAQVEALLAIAAELAHVVEAIEQASRR